MMQWNLPGSDRFLNDIVDSLCEGKHVAMVLPETISRSDMIFPLRHKVREFGYGDIVVHHAGEQGDELIDILAIALGCNPNDFSTYNELLGYAVPLSRILAFDLAALKNTSIMMEWSSLLVRAAEHAKNHGGGQYQFLVMTDPEAEIPPEDVYLAHHQWWGVLGTTDIDWVVERCLEIRPPASTGEHYWIRSLCRGLSGNDVALAERLIENMPVSIDDVLKLLKDYCKDSRYLTDVPLEVERLITPYGRKVPPPPRDSHSRELWRGGWIDWVKGRGRFLHSSVLAVKEEREEVCRRVWIAQQEMVLPLVEKVRLLVVGWLEKVIGPDWIDVLTPNLSQEDRENVETEIGSLAHHIFNRSRKFPRQEFTTVASMVWTWWAIRNGLAHGRYVSLSSLENAWSTYDQFVKRCT